MSAEQKQLLHHINAVSFAAFDTHLFLDTHPDCEEAKDYFCQMVAKRDKAIAEYERLYALLFADASCENSCDGENWSWATTPWPWEKGAC